MTKGPKYLKIGFDHKVLTTALIGKLVAEGTVKGDDPRILVWRGRLPASGGIRGRFANLHALGMEHLSLHGMQRDGTKCARRRCRAAGISVAIVEIAEYFLQKGDDGGALALSREIDRFSSSPAMLFATARWYADRNPRSRATDAVNVAMGELEFLMGALKDVKDELLDPLSSQFDQAPSGGKPAERLLTAIYQHLKKTGGLLLPELVQLPLQSSDLKTLGTDSLALPRFLGDRAEAIKGRLKSRDVRKWHPYVPKGARTAARKARE